MSEPDGQVPAPKQGWLTHLSEADRSDFQETTSLIEILTGRVHALGQIDLLDLSVAEPLDGQALAQMLKVHARQALDQVDVLQQLSEQYAHLAGIAESAPAT